MADRIDAQIDPALERGRMARQNEPRAVEAHYDKDLGLIVVSLTNGAVFAFPPHLAEGLADAPMEKLQDVEVLGNGHGLHWESLDVDFSVPGLVNGVFGTAKWMAARAGRVSSPAKAAAARANGALGGRPRKNPIGQQSTHPSGESPQGKARAKRA